MSAEAIDRLIRKYLSAGLTVAVVLVGPATDGVTAPPDRTTTVTLDPVAAAADPADPTGTDPTRADSARAGSTGTDPTRAGSARAGSAAERYGWGAPDREDDFSGADGTEGWNVYDGPGHAGNGTRSPAAAAAEGGVLTLTGDRHGTTAGMAWNPGQRYGRWEARVRAQAGAESYHALLLLWPDAEDFPVGGEIDFLELTEATRRRADLFLHHGADNAQVHGQVEIDAARWHDWALEWTPTAITAYVDGEQWYRTTDTDIFPPGPMHLCIQLDWFPGDADGRRDVQDSRMEVDWVRQFSLDNGG